MTPDAESAPRGLEIAVVGSATSHAVASVRALRELDPIRRIVAVGFDDRSRASALRVPGVRATSTLPDRANLAGVIYAEDMAERIDELAAVLAAGLPVYIHKPAVRDRATLSRLREPLLGAPDRVLTGSILRFSPALSDTGLSTASRVQVEVQHPLCGRRLGETGSGWRARIARHFGIHGLDLLDRLGRRPEACRAAAWDETAQVLSLHVTGLRGTDLVEIGTTSLDESYVVSDGQRRIALLDTEIDPLGHEAMHRAFLDMVDGAPSPVDVHRSLTILAATLDAADHAAERRGTAHPDPKENARA